MPSAICQMQLVVDGYVYVLFSNNREGQDTRLASKRGMGIILFSILSLLFYFFDGGKLAVSFGESVMYFLFLHILISIKLKKVPLSFIMLLKDKVMADLLMHTFCCAYTRS